MNNKIIIYFSVSGRTREASQNLAKIESADIYEIKPVIPYTNDDINWTNSKSRTSIEMNDKSSRPEIVKEEINLEKYDTICIAFPIWWGVAPHVINTFIESNDLSNKKIVVYCTSGGSSVEPAVSDLQETYPNLSIETGKRL